MSADNWTKYPKCGKEDILREDWDVGMRGAPGEPGVFSIEYYASCGTRQDKGCGFTFTYKHAVNPTTGLFLS